MGLYRARSLFQNEMRVCVVSVVAALTFTDEVLLLYHLECIETYPPTSK